MANFSSFKVPKQQEQKMRAGSARDPRGPDREAKASNISMPTPAAQGGTSMPASVTNDAHFKESFSADGDLRTLIAAARIRGDKARFQNAMARFTELKGRNNQGVRTHRNNANDHRSMTRIGTDGASQMDGTKGRW
jgi:hypothetical protein